jgi:hypothetical protein
MNTINIPGISPWILVLIVLWTIPWKGIALWKSARLSHKWWFVIILVVNTVGILEIIYIFLIARKYNVETMERPDADIDEPLSSSSGDTENEHSRQEGNIGTETMTSISQIIKTVETKNTVVPPKKESSKPEIEEDPAEKAESSMEK